jgi:hypothetical protein
MGCMQTRTTSVAISYSFWSDGVRHSPNSVVNTSDDQIGHKPKYVMHVTLTPSGYNITG